MSSQVISWLYPAYGLCLCRRKGELKKNLAFRCLRSGENVFKPDPYPNPEDNPDICARTNAEHSPCPRCSGEESCIKVVFDRELAVLGTEWPDKKYDLIELATMHEYWREKLEVTTTGLRNVYDNLVQGLWQKCREEATGTLIEDRAGPFKRFRHQVQQLQSFAYHFKELAMVHKLEEGKLKIVITIFGQAIALGAWENETPGRFLKRDQGIAKVFEQADELTDAIFAGALRDTLRKTLGLLL
ncbi:hypothetical protein BKA67DRAFT_541555 [Truncatella angustata]|uniref:Uncharacterized protein n=1 Tax=Truncatella angustata TaxID=152316 RepID=A0A9P8RLG9_9PEZI|nr:uncharacterized protein BKA67DRAFT_541555 [Truncatella angustata]KAH6645326.1 hypothetical protein BKA67DRAFT_541555 [Truncatella angustata]KAH8203306.1 hypothetical protein TruAng_002502 [Truncatella angustata]